MSDRPISFTVANFSEQILHPKDFAKRGEYQDGIVYSAVMHVDGEVVQWKKFIHPDFVPPIAAIRSEAWLALLQQISEKRK